MFKVLLLFLSIHLFAIQPEDYFQNTPFFKQSFVGVYIEDLHTKEALCKLNEDHLFIPASIQKVLVSYAAISILGTDFRFETDLEIQGTIDPKTKTLYGNVWIRGGGDPSLDLSIIETWTQALRQKGIEKVEGKIVADVSSFDTIFSSPYWYFEDLGSGDGVPVSALNINQNVYELTVQPGEQNARAEVVSIKPPIPYLTYFNEIVTKDKDSRMNISIYGSDYSSFQFYRGSVPSSKESFKTRGTISDPPLLCASLLAKKIKPSKGVDVLRYPQKDQESGDLVYRHSSSSIDEIIRQMNTRSINLYAEILVKTVGNGNTKQGMRAINNFYKNLGVSCILKDGSGLARTNYLSPKDFVTILKKIYHDPLYAKIHDSLAEPSMEGTLKNFPKIEGATLKAKTGSMSHVRSLGGYLHLSNGKEYAFCLICNHYPKSIADIRQAEAHFLSDFVQEYLKSQSIK